MGQAVLAQRGLPDQTWWGFIAVPAPCLLHHTRMQGLVTPMLHSSSEEHDNLTFFTSCDAMALFMESSRASPVTLE